ncbi:MAG: threonylcarbamoyl-AMP synthase [Spirochaetaceae bacterium]|jgi:L-threonylcarbamoyladenylate synthase|nr:threonylcarbamoyl-AMP synthase [Spirochaetaceae bacterium]
MINLGVSAADLSRAAGILREGGLVAFPTETVYGLGAGAFNSPALARVFEVKGRPRFDPLIIHIAGMDGLERVTLVETLPQSLRIMVEALTRTFWPGPLTLVLPKRPELPGLATAGLSTAAVRFPNHPAAQKLIALSTGAVAAPSANPFGRLSPTRAAHVAEGLGDKIDCLIDGGPCSVGVESTVLSLTEDPPRLLRPGGISRESLEALTGPVAAGTETTETAPESPGLLKSHYAPEIPLVFHSPEEMAALPRGAQEGLLFFSGAARDAWLRKNPGAGQDPADPRILALSESGSVREAAANLFQYLHRLDRLNLRRIRAELLPEEGLGAAVNDRLRRAGFPRRA